MATLDRVNRAILTLASLLIPVVGIVGGAYYTLKPEREGDFLGPLCFVLGVCCLVVWNSFPLFM